MNARERGTVAKNLAPADSKQCCFPSRGLSFRCAVDTQASLVEKSQARLEALLCALSNVGS